MLGSDPNPDLTTTKPQNSPRISAGWRWVLCPYGLRGPGWNPNFPQEASAGRTRGQDGPPAPPSPRVMRKPLNQRWAGSRQSELGPWAR